MPRLSFSPQRPQLPRLPHLPGTDQGAGSLANLSSCGYCGACCALAAASDSKNTPAAAPPATRIDVRRFMASPSQERCRRPISRALEHDRNTLEHYHSARGRYNLAGGPVGRKCQVSSQTSSIRQPLKMLLTMI